MGDNMGKHVNLIGKKFNRLTVVRQTDKRDSNGNIIWLCVCDCGNMVEQRGGSLTSGHAKSCGCWHRERSSVFAKKHLRTHGLRKHRLYTIWEHMKQRCYNVNNKSYKDYGARGITVCNEWRCDFLSFFNWAIDNGYRENLTIDRINNNGNYEPSNCRWATNIVQNRNKRHLHMITYNHKTQTLVEWSEVVGIKYNTLERRINKYGWSIERALTTPTRKRG